MFKETRPHDSEVSNQLRIRHGNRVPEDAVNLAYTYVSPIQSTENVRTMDMSEFILENSNYKPQILSFYPTPSGVLEDANHQMDVYTQSLHMTHVYDEEEPLFYMYELKEMFYSKDAPKPYEYPKIKSILILDKDGNNVQPPLRYRMQLIRTAHPNLFKVRIFTNFERKPGDDYSVLYSAVELTERGEIKTKPGTTEALNPRPAFTMKSDIALADLEYHLTPSVEFGYNRIYVGENSFYSGDYRDPIPLQYSVVAMKDGEIVLDTPNIHDNILHPASVLPYPNDQEYINGAKILFNGKTPREILSIYYPSFRHEEGMSYQAICMTTNVVMTTDDAGDRAIKAVYRGDTQTGKIDLPPKYRISKVGKEREIEIKITMFNWKNPNQEMNLPPIVAIVKGEPYESASIHSIQINPFEFNLPSSIIPEEWEVVFHTDAPIELWAERDGVIDPSSFGQFSQRLDVLMTVPYYVLRYRYCEMDDYYQREYSVLLQDQSSIKLLAPLEAKEHDYWYPRIQNGKFQKRVFNENTKEDDVYLYSIPEYYRQWFDEGHGLPVRKVIEEKPKIVGERKIKLRHTPLYVTLSDNVPNLQVVSLIKPETEDMTDEERQKNRIPLQVRAWDTSSGIVELYDGVKENDIILVTYYYEEYAYTYRGFWDEERGRFWHLDLNPTHGHTVTIYDTANDEVRDEPSYWLINQTIYFYLKPTGKLQDKEEIQEEELRWLFDGTDEKGKYSLFETRYRVSTRYPYTITDSSNHILHYESASSSSFFTNHFRVYHENPLGRMTITYTHEYDFLRLIPKTFQRESVFHTFSPIDEMTMREKGYLLLGRIQVRPNSKIDNLQVYDTRTRGGGLKKEIQDAIIKDLCPEAQFYWDIGYWDGEPYPENAVLTIRLPRYILKGHGGIFSIDDVRRSIEKHIAYGTFYLLEFIDESIEMLDTPWNLEASVVTLPDDTIELEQPQFHLTIKEVDCYYDPEN